MDLSATPAAGTISGVSQVSLVSQVSHAGPVTPAVSTGATPAVALMAGLRPGASGATAAAQLLLFVGEAIRPDTTLSALLAREGQRCLSLPGTEQALRAAALAHFDAVIIDAALVDGRAGRAIETLAATHHCPVVVLADHADEVDEIMALELGADLYLAKPLAPRRLRAHLQALLRRREAAVGSAPAPARPGHVPPALQAAGWTLEAGQLKLTRDEPGPSRSVRLTPAQTALLRCLMAAGGRIVPAAELLAALPHPHAEAAGREGPHEGQPPARSLRIYMHRLRQRLREDGVHELVLESVRGRGYALVAPPPLHAASRAA
jgi:DNA-binding response OmpR family regulator